VQTTINSRIYFRQNAACFGSYIRSTSHYAVLNYPQDNWAASAIPSYLHSTISHCGKFRDWMRDASMLSVWMLSLRL
jgi:hypothetical protein